MTSNSKKTLDFDHLKKQWDKQFILRKEVYLFSEGLLSPTQMATFDCRNQGPEGSFYFGRHVAYPIDLFIFWMENRFSRPTKATARKQDK